MAKTDLKTLYSLFLSTAKIGAVSFGGGYGMIPIMEEEFVNNRKWVQRHDILDIFAIAQSLPGVIALNTCTFIGYRVCGLPGAVIAATGVSLPSFCILAVLASFYIQFQSASWVVSGSIGINACVVALVFGAVLNMGASAIKDFFGWVIAVLGFVGIVFLKISPVLCIGGAAVIGLLMAIISKRKKGAPTDDDTD